MARGELGEVRSRLVHAGSRGYFTNEQHVEITELARRALAVTTALLRSKLPQLRRGKRRESRTKH
jgi:hypothetical protein